MKKLVFLFIVFLLILSSCNCESTQCQEEIENVSEQNENEIVQDEEKVYEAPIPPEYVRKGDTVKRIEASLANYIIYTRWVAEYEDAMEMGVDLLYYREFVQGYTIPDIIRQYYDPNINYNAYLYRKEDIKRLEEEYGYGGNDSIAYYNNLKKYVCDYETATALNISYLEYRKLTGEYNNHDKYELEREPDGYFENRYQRSLSEIERLEKTYGYGQD